MQQIHHWFLDYESQVCLLLNLHFSLMIRVILGQLASYKCPFPNEISHRASLLEYSCNYQHIPQDLGSN